MKKYTFENISLFIAFAFTVFMAFSQNQEKLSFSLDPKMMIQGDADHNIPEGTLNFIVNFEAQTKQQTQGYWIFYIQMEYADFNETYKRYAAGCGYTFNQFLKFVDFSVSLNIGAIDRFDRLALGFESVGKIAFPIGKRLTLFGMGSLTDRRDIVYQLNPHNPQGHYWQPNAYVGASFKIFKL